MLILNDAKEVKYFGFTFFVPNGVNYMAIDACGDIYGYARKPKIDESCEMFDPISTGDYYLINDNCFKVTGDWKLSLQKV